MKAYTHEKDGKIFVEMSSNDIPHFTVFINKKEAVRQLTVYPKRYKGCGVVKIKILMEAKAKP